MRMKLIREDAHRAAATPAKETTYVDDNVGENRDQAEHLALVRAVPDDAEPTGLTMGRVVAQGAARRSEFLDGRKTIAVPTKIDQCLDGGDQRLYDDHVLFDQRWSEDVEIRRFIAFLVP